jgi:hypothetical protein
MTNDPLSAEAQLKPLTDLWMHQNNLMWSRVRLLAALQASALVANYVLKDRAASTALCVVAAAATFFLIYISDVDRIIRDDYRERLKGFGFRIGFDRAERVSRRTHIAGFHIRTSVTASITLRVIFWAMMVCDFVVLSVSLAVFR